MTPARDNIILVVVNLDPQRSQNSYVHVPMEDFGAMDADTYQVHDLLSDARYIWHGSANYVELESARCSPPTSFACGAGWPGKSLFERRTFGRSLEPDALQVA